MPAPNGWSEVQFEEALAELHRRHPNLSGGMFRVLLKTAMKHVQPPDMPALIRYADSVIAALKAE